METLNEWSFGINNNKLIELVLAGVKTATTSLYDEQYIPKVGEKSILIYDNGKQACITETKKVIITEFKNITPELAYLEGEGDRTLGYWRNVHYQYFKSINNIFSENSKVIFEIFEVVKKFV